MTGKAKKAKIIISVLIALAVLWAVAISVLFALHLSSEAKSRDNEFLGVYVCGTPVTKKNADDVLGDGTVMFDLGSGMLLLSNACLETTGSAAIFSEIDLTIALGGENRIICNSPESTAGVYASNLMLRKDVSFIGAGTLTIENTEETGAVIGGIVADDVWAYSNISIDLSGAAEESAGIECAYLCLMGENTVSVKLDSVGKSMAVSVRGDILLCDNSTLDVSNVNAGEERTGIECTGSFIAGTGSTVCSTATKDGGVLCYGVFCDRGANVDCEIEAVAGIRYED